MRLPILLACVATLSAQTSSLTVQQGSATRNPAAGAVAHVWANPNTATTLFNGWAGDVQYLLDPAAWHTTLVMPATTLNLRATYRTVPAWTQVVGTFNNISVTYYIPPNPIGLIFSFHGTGGTGTGQFSGTEFQALNREAVAAGFGVAAFDSLDRTVVVTGSALPGQWNTAIAGAANPDIVRLNGILQAMRSQGLIAAQLPLFAFGHSNGGSFAHFFSDRLLLNLYATGLRLAPNSQVQVLIGPETITPLFAGDQGQFPGLDQVTLELPGSFAGCGSVQVAVVANGVRSNPVELLFGT
ncbi:MAG: hypothetical protein M3Z32_02200 [Acidobacteriota bacterium]|nr:hypothetical protein [Acidobacteriota bacterium]